MSIKLKLSFLNYKEKNKTDYDLHLKFSGKRFFLTDSVKYLGIKIE